MKAAGSALFAALFTTSVAGAQPTSDEAGASPKGEATSLKLDLYADAYGGWQSSGSGTLATLSGHRAFAGQGANLRAENGFALAFLGLDAAYDTGRFGVLGSLRFGQGAAIYHHAEDGEDVAFGIDNVTQALMLYRPVDTLELGFGLFSTPFGAEASLESWKNLNYTLGALAFYAQPNWVTGLRVGWQLVDSVELVAFVANGINIVSETQQNNGADQTPNVGAAVTWSPSEALSLSLGGLQALDASNNDDSGLDTFLDFVGSAEVGDLTAILNANLVVTRDEAPDGGDRQLWGASLAVGYQLIEPLGVAVRGEYLRDKANYGGGDVWNLVTGTLTLDVRPLPGIPNLIVRWDNRVEKSNQDVFGKDSRGTADTDDDSYGATWFETVVGVVVTTAP